MHLIGSLDLGGNIYYDGSSPIKLMCLRQIFSDRQCYHLRRNSRPTQQDVVFRWGNALPIHDSGDARLIRFEDGFVRSRGLGVHLSIPFSYIFDSVSPYHNDPSIETDLIRILNDQIVSNDQRSLGKELIALLRQHNITKYNLSTLKSKPYQFPKNRKPILILEQVPTDNSLYGTKYDIVSVIKQVKENNLSSFVCFKRHPDVVSKIRSSNVRSDLISKYSDLEICEYAVDYEDFDEIHTVSSLSGLECLIRGIPVYCYGTPFYSGYGLTIDCSEQINRRRTLELPELVYLALVAYPKYFCYGKVDFSIFDAIDMIKQGQAYKRKYGFNFLKNTLSILTSKLF